MNDWTSSFKAKPTKMSADERSAKMAEEIAEVRRQNAKVVDRCQGHTIVVTHESETNYSTRCLGCGEQHWGEDKESAMWRWANAASPCRSPWVAEAKIDEIRDSYTNRTDDGEQITLKTLFEAVQENQHKLDRIIKHLKI